MTDGDGILRAKSSYVSGNLLLIRIYLEGPIDHVLRVLATIPLASTDCYGL